MSHNINVNHDEEKIEQNKLIFTLDTRYIQVIPLNIYIFMEFKYLQQIINIRSMTTFGFAL